MSVAVDLSALEAEIARRGEIAFLVTAAPGAPPHVMSVRVAFVDRALTMGAGRTSRRNVAEAPTVTLLWATATDAEYCLLVDGTAVVVADTEVIEVQPTRAILHRLAGAAADLPYCAEVDGA